MELEASLGGVFQPAKVGFQFQLTSHGKDEADVEEDGECEATGARQREKSGETIDPSPGSGRTGTIDHDPS